METVYGPVHVKRSLTQANAGRADLFIACARPDSQKLLACMAAKRLGVTKTVCFLLRREFQDVDDDGSELAGYLPIDQAVIRPSEQQVKAPVVGGDHLLVLSTREDRKKVSAFFLQIRAKATDSAPD